MCSKPWVQHMRCTEQQFGRNLSAEERMLFQQAFEAGYARAVLSGQNLIPIQESSPDPDQFDRVIVFTQGVDFAGEQFFDVPADSLLSINYPDPDDRPPVIAAATHWMPHPQAGAAKDF